MGSRLTSTEVARRFGDVLAEVKHAGTTVVVTRNGEPVAELRPVEAAKTCTVSQFAELWAGEHAEPDDTFARDLERANRSDQPAVDPWE